jgi:hypothetical protein
MAAIWMQRTTWNWFDECLATRRDNQLCEFVQYEVLRSLRMTGRDYGASLQGSELTHFEIHRGA